jgi:hypothetical protein
MDIPDFEMINSPSSTNLEIQAMLFKNNQLSENVATNIFL